jgi:hypothetical protein
LGIKKIYFLLLLFIFSGCTQIKEDDNLNNKLIKKIYSSDKSISVKIIEQSYGGATGDYKFKVIFSNADNNSEILSAYKVKTIDIKWKNENTLILSISSDRIIHYTNYWYDNNSKIMYKIILLEIK